MEVDHFIESVRKYPCLWNTTAIEYRDNELKDAAWKQLIKETDMPSLRDAKLKWKKLRDSYRDALKRESAFRQGSGGSGGANKRPLSWRYMEQMSFLQPHMYARKISVATPSAEDTIAASPAAAASSRVNGHEPNSDSECDSERVYSPNTKQTMTSALNGNDPIALFFSSMCETTKQLPPAVQLRVKRAVFACVQEAEEEHIMQQQQLAQQHLAAYASAVAAAANSSPAAVKIEPVEPDAAFDNYQAEVIDTKLPSC